MISIFDRVENIVGKAENTGNQLFLIFPQYFEKPFFLRVINPFPNKPWFLRVYGLSLLKTLWEKEKMLVTSILSFSHSVFYSIKKK